MSNICQCCKTNEELNVLEEKLAKTLTSCFAITINNNADSQICQRCIAKVNDANNFKLLVLETQISLKGLLVKREPVKYEPFQTWDDIGESIHGDSFDDRDDFLEVEIDAKHPLKPILSIAEYLKTAPEICLKSSPFESIEDEIIKVRKSKKKGRKKKKNKKEIKMKSPPPKKPRKEPEHSIEVYIPIEMSAENKMRLEDIVLEQEMCRPKVQVTPRNPGVKRERTKQCDKIVMPRVGKDDRKCPVCGDEFETSRALMCHMNAHYRNFICETCGKGFMSKSNFNTHLLTHTSKCKCDICDKELSTQMSLIGHMRHRHGTERKLYKCHICGERFYHFYLKMKHVEAVHGVTQRRHKCQVCDKTFLLGALLTVHIRKHHRVRERNHACQLCGAAFFEKSTLNSHMMSHTGERPFQCTQCPKAYPRACTLKEHMRTHDNDRRFSCHICGRGFTQKSSLKGHLKTHEKEAAQCNTGIPLPVMAGIIET